VDIRTTTRIGNTSITRNSKGARLYQGNRMNADVVDR